MEWVETTAKSIGEAQDQALDQLGVAADEAEFEILEEPKSGLFGRVRGEARVRARVKPTAVRPKQERRQRGRNQKRDGDSSGGDRQKNDSNGDQGGPRSEGADAAPAKADPAPAKAKSARSKQQRQQKEKQRMDNERPSSEVTPQEVGEAAVTFMSQLTAAFGVEEAGTELEVDGTDLDVRVTGSELGLMV